MPLPDAPAGCRPKRWCSLPASAAWHATHLPPPPPASPPLENQVDALNIFNTTDLDQILESSEPPPHRSASNGQIKFILLEPDAKLPARQSEGAAGFDLYILRPLSIPPGQVATIETGVGLSIPPNELIHAEILPRSSIAPCFNVITIPGVIDRDYKGELKIVVFNHSYHKTQHFPKHTRLAQLVFRHTISPSLLEKVPAHEVWGTPRNERGFGSTGLTHNNDIECCPLSISPSTPSPTF